MNPIPRFNARNLPDAEYFIGHKACAGCGASLVVRLALKVLGPDTFSILPAGCMSAVGFVYPQMAFTRNAMISTFPGAASMASGVRAAARSLGLEQSHTVVFAGDGGTADIGLQALSGMIDRGDRVIYICYDNEAYMNTGIQKSGLTPYGASTTTSPAGKRIPGSERPKKRLFEIIAAHDIPYAASASMGYPEDFMAKVARAAQVDGPSFIHVMASCPTGWGTPTEEAIEIAKEAVDTGLWVLAEYEGGTFRLTHDPKTFKPVEPYFQRQKRFRHLREDDLARCGRERDQRWEQYRRLWEAAP